MAVPLSMQSHVRESGRPYTPNPRRQEEPAHQMVQGQVQETNPIQPAVHTQEEEHQDLMAQEEHSPPGGGCPGGNPGGNSTPPGSTPPQQSGGAGNPGGNPPTAPPVTPPSSRSIDPWASLDRSRKPLPKLSLPPNYKSCSILDVQQLLEVWYDRSTFAIATWRGDAQRYWLTQVLDCARARHDQWLQSSPAQRATLEPVYILGDRKHILDAQNAVESVLRTELLEVIPKSIADACMRHGYCAAELIVWYVMKQLTLPPDINEVTMQKEILTPHKVSPATLDQACAWPKEMQH